MNIQSTHRSPLKTPLTTPQTNPQAEAKEPCFSKDEVKLGASMVGGGLLLGAGGMWLGAEVGLQVASKVFGTIGDGQPVPIKLIAVLATLPASLAYAGIGAVAGGALGGLAGAALGDAAYDHFNK